MPTITMPLTIGAATNYARTTSNFSTIDGDVWTNRVPGLISASLVSSTSLTRVDIRANANIYNLNSSIEVADIVFDMSLLGLVTITDARLYFTTSTASIKTGVWGTVPRDSITLVSQKETVRSSAPDGDNYLAIYDGAINGTELVNTRLSLSGMSPSTRYHFELNAAGVAYLNTVLTKANLEVYALFGIVYGGMVDAVDPSPLSAGVDNLITLVDDIYFELDYTVATGCSINIADVWKDIIGAQLNVTGAAWKAVSDIKINVGDDWKDRA